MCREHRKLRVRHSSCINTCIRWQHGNKWLENNHLSDKSEATVKSISVRYVIEILMEHGIHCLPCSYTNDVIGLLPQQIRRHIDFKVTSSGRHSDKVLRTTVGYSLVAMVTHLTYNSRGEWHTVYVMLLSNYKYCMSCSSRLMSEMLPEMHIVEKYFFSNI